ncbi:MAG: hypothetical protein U9Q92_04095 [archaeon]|nr:hypothetical protein [archaeon]
MPERGPQAGYECSQKIRDIMGIYIDNVMTDCALDKKNGHIKADVYFAGEASESIIKNVCGITSEIDDKSLRAEEAYDLLSDISDLVNEGELKINIEAGPYDEPTFISDIHRKKWDDRWDNIISELNESELIKEDEKVIHVKGMPLFEIKGIEYQEREYYIGLMVKLLELYCTTVDVNNNHPYVKKTVLEAEIITDEMPKPKEVIDIIGP